MTNRTLLKIFKARLEGAKGAWVVELLSVLYAYRTIARSPTGETPFNLTFGTEAVVLVEVGLTSFRATMFNESKNDEELKVNLDLLDELREIAYTRMARYQNRVSRYYNNRVKARRFEEGDLVLRKVTQATKEPTQGIFGPN